MIETLTLDSLAGTRCLVMMVRSGDEWKLLVKAMSTKSFSSVSRRRGEEVQKPGQLEGNQGKFSRESDQS